MLKYIKVNEERRSYYIKKGWWSETTLLDCWEEAVSKYADREYVVDDRGNRYTYEKLDILSEKLASYFNDIGIKSGDIISYQIPVWSEFVIISIACLKVGAVMNPVAMFYGKEELKGLLSKTKSKLYIGTTFFNKTDYEKQILSLRESNDFSGDIIFLDNLKLKESDFISFRQIMDKDYKKLDIKRDFTGFDVCLILSTSGTCGGNKGVLLTHNNIISSEKELNKELGLKKEDIMFMASPLNHASGFHHGLISTMLAGAKVVLQQKFRVEEAADIIDRESCTYSMGATPFIYDILRLLKASNRKLESFKLYLCGGAPVPSYLIAEGEAFGITICEVYGSTESVPHTFVRIDEAKKHNGLSSGRPIEGVEVKVVDENRKEVPFGTMGEEASRGPNVFVGYLENKEATDSCLDDEGWFYSGDLCTCDEYGNIHIIGRKKDMILRGGENLDANAIDEFIEGFEGIRDHTVIGMPDERLGERICAYVVCEEGAEKPDLEKLKAYLKTKDIPKRFLPERLEVIDAIPKTHSGKVKKFLLVEDISKKLEKEK